MGRTYLLSLILCGVLPGLVAAQPPTGAGQGNPAGQAAPQPPVTALTPEQLQVIEGVLKTWEADAKSLQSLYVQFEETHEDAIFKKQTKFMGEAKVLKMPTGTYGLRLEIYALGADGKADYSKMKQKYVCSGPWMYEFKPESRIILFRRLDNINIKPDDGPFAFVMGMNMADANKRFKLDIAQQDKDWTWLRVEPRTEQDNRDFTLAMLGLVNYANVTTPKFFPLQIKWREPGKNVRTWTFKQVIRNDPSKVTAMDFTIEEDKKRGWQLKEAPPLGATLPTPGAPGTPTGNPRK
jgi:TIGR03009 family protein